MTGPSRLHDAAFALLLALVATAIGYRFGTGNQFEQLPIVLRAIDPTYLANDPFVSASSGVGPRFYFAQLVAFICRLLPLAWAYAVLRLASDVALVAVTMWAARRVVGADRLGSMMAAVLTVAVSSIHLGDAAELRYEVFQPASLSIPGMLLAFALGIRGQPIAAACVAGAASLPHPLYGVYAGVFGLCTASVALAIRHAGQGTAAMLRAALIRPSIGAAIFGLVVLVFWWWPAQTPPTAPLTTEELFAILARFRSPHHYLPSQFRAQDYVTLACLAWVGWLAFEPWSRGAPADVSWPIRAAAAIVAAGCIAGVLFVEVWPVRAVLTLQLFRLLAILKWLVFLMLGWLLASYWQRPPAPIARPVVALSLLSAGGTHPLVSAAGVSLVRFRSWLPAAVPPMLPIALLTLGAIVLWVLFGPPTERLRLFAAVGLMAAFAARSRGLRLAAAAAVLAGSAAILSNRPQAGPPVSPLQASFSFEDLHDLQAETARAAARQTPADAIFVAPPQFGILRLVGRRALVVDFEAVPFQDDAMRAWRERVRDVYGDVEGGGLAARAALDHRYRSVTDAHLRGLAQRYGATHAVLYAETGTGLPVLFENDTYRIVQLQP